MRFGDAMAVVAKYDLTSVVPVGPELWVVGAGLVEALVTGAGPYSLDRRLRDHAVERTAVADCPPGPR